MKKYLFYGSILISVFLLINILSILISDFSRLTTYGFGYLTGKIIMLLIFLTLSFIVRKHKTVA
ncbi:hypothetical protein SAMN05660703_1683 [Cellulophaga tyrosinoxydans]|uniref:Uncharacterized protein n=1 Tax=Cellulophaga tyrosinoxydans TaxID=504486 RepID=A0A1W2A0J9_9FLAO|nr:hypothetical protein SAMN05660703_1683 [Cellulophaga tyrosinoxydans]